MNTTSIAIRYGRILFPLVLSVLLFSCSDDDGPVDPNIPKDVIEVEKRVHALINDYRASKGLPTLTLHAVISEQSRLHSRNMAEGEVPFSHDGFDERIEAIRTRITVIRGSENVAFNSGYADPARTAVNGWIQSTGHRNNIEGDYNLTGIGVWKNSAGAWYLTQIFVHSR